MATIINQKQNLSSWKIFFTQSAFKNTKTVVKKYKKKTVQKEVTQGVANINFKLVLL